MLRRLLNYQLALCEEGKPLFRFRRLISALDAFCYEAPLNTRTSPFIRDAVDLKRWMILVIVALLPVIIMAIWNTGVQSFVYKSGDFKLMREFLDASTSFHGYFEFVGKEGRYLTILKLGSLAFLPVMLISYLVGGLCEAVVATLRGHEIAEGFLVTGMLYPLILPPTIPYWMVALGVAFGVLVGKELFGGTGMNILNPALTCRAFLFFTFPSKMSGDVWVGTNPTVIAGSLSKMNAEGHLSEIDGISQVTALGTFNGAIDDVKRVHVDAIALNNWHADVPTRGVIESQFEKWHATRGSELALGDLSSDQLRDFLTTPLPHGGLGLGSGNMDAAAHFAHTAYGEAPFSDGNLFFGNMLGSMGETSTFACLLGALFLLYVGIGSWRTMLSMGLIAFLTAYLFEFFATHTGSDGGAWNAARYALPAYKHLLMGGLAFGLVFMATDPVSAPTMNGAKWIYGGLIGLVTIVIRVINPAYPEGVMLAILFGNVFAPLIDHFTVIQFRRRRRVRTVPALP